MCTAATMFRFYGAKFAPFSPTRLDMSLDFGLPAFLYAIPTFQNPTGRCYSKEERDKLALFCERHGVTLFEDDPTGIWSTIPARRFRSVRGFGKPPGSIRDRFPRVWLPASGWVSWPHLPISSPTWSA